MIAALNKHPTGYLGVLVEQSRELEVEMCHCYHPAIPRSCPGFPGEITVAGTGSPGPYCSLVDLCCLSTLHSCFGRRS